MIAKDYEKEYDSWLEEQAILLREKKFDRLDIDNLIEELDSLGKELRNKVRSLTIQIVIHQLLLDYWYEESPHCSNHWQSEILAFQDDLQQSLTTNLLNFLVTNSDEIYNRAKKRAELKMNKFDRIPSQNPYDLIKLITEN